MTAEARGFIVLRAVALTFYRILLVAYPAPFRSQDGAEAIQLFADACVESWREGGWRALARRAGRALLDVPRYGIAERRAARLSTRTMHTHRQFLAALISDVRYGVRSIVRRPALSAAIVTTLALGIGANTAMFSVIDATLLRPLPYPDAGRVAYLRVRDSASESLRAPTAAELLRWSPLVQAFERAEGRSSKPALVLGDGEATETNLFQVTGGYFAARRVRPILGRLLLAGDVDAGVPIAVMAERFWRTRYGARADVVGRAISIDGSAHVIVGVAPHLRPDVPGANADVYALLPTRGEAPARTRVHGIVWLKPGVSLSAAQDELSAVSAAHDSGSRAVGVLERPGSIFWNVSVYRDSQLSLMIAVSLLLVIAGVNVANLLLASGHSRRPELAVRSALGAGRHRLVRLLLIENVLLSFAGSAAGVLVAWYAVRVFAALGFDARWQANLDGIRLDGVVLGYAVGIALLTGLVAGLVPAFGNTRRMRLDVMADTGGRATSGGGRFRGALVAAEVALLVVLLAAAGLAVRAFMQMRLADLGFDADRIVTVRLSLPWARYPTPERRAAFFEQLRTEALRVPGVTRAVVGTSIVPPHAMLFDITVDADTAAPVESSSDVTFTEPGYFDAMGIPLIAGRDFLPTELRRTTESGESAAIVNESAARQLWPGENPLGREFRLEYMGLQQMRVVGVARDVRGFDLADVSCCDWRIYAPLLVPELGTELVIRVADGAPPPLAAIRSTIRRLDHEIPIDDGVELAESRVYRSLRPPRFRAAIFGGLAALGLTLVGFGITTVVSYSVSRRTREMGIRLALGARPWQVRQLILKEGLTPVVAGMGLGLGAALVATRAMAHLLPGVSPADPAILAGMIVAMIAIAAGAIWVPAARATRVSPVSALRHD